MIDDELRALVSVDPPPGWDARVKARVAADGEAGHRGLMRNLALAAAAVVVIAVGASLWSNRTLDSRSAAVPAALEARALSVNAWPSMQHATRPARPALPALPALPAPGGAIQVDEREARALRELFASASGLQLAVPEPRTGPIVVPDIAIEPIVDPNSEGDRP